MVQQRFSAEVGRRKKAVGSDKREERSLHPFGSSRECMSTDTEACWLKLTSVREVAATSILEILAHDGAESEYGAPVVYQGK